MKRKLGLILLAATTAWAGLACEEEGDVTTLMGPVLDMIVDAKVAGGFPALEVRNVAFVNKSPSQLTLELRFLDPVAGGVAYQLFLVSLDGSRSVPAKASYSTIRADSTRVSRDSVAVTITVTDRGKASGTVGGPVNVTHRFVIDEADLLPDSLDHFAYVVVAVQGSGTALDGNAPAPLWFQYRNPAITELPDTRAWRTGRASFGLFAGAKSYPFNAGGQGLGGFFQERLVVHFTHLPRPPRGYTYRAWLVKADNTAKDLGPLLSPHPELASLENADVSAPTPVVQETEIVYATVATDEAKIGARFHDFDLFLVTLELKSSGPAMGPAAAVGGPLPGGVLERRAAK